MDKTIYDLELHEASTNIPGIEATRVPGGWIYRYWNDDAQDYYGSGIFVPFNNEFQNSENVEQQTDEPTYEAPDPNTMG